MLKTIDIHRYYDMGENRIHALRGVSFEVGRGDFVAIMGASGKSTLMNILGCLDRPDSGRYILDGADIAEMDKNELAALRNRKLGFVFQSFNLIARTSAIENIALPTLYARIGKAERIR